MGSGSDLLLGNVYSLLHSIDIARACIDHRQQFRGIQAPKGGLRNLEHFPDDCGSGVDFVETFGCGRAQPDGREAKVCEIPFLPTRRAMLCAGLCFGRARRLRSAMLASWFTASFGLDILSLSMSDHVVTGLFLFARLKCHGLKAMALKSC
jgi:hypothetical protein